jgi:putative transposase
MDIKRSTLYYQPKGNLDKKIRETNIKKKIEDISREHPYYGYRRITASLRRDKAIVNPKKGLKMMKKLGIQGRIKRKYMTTTNNKHHNRIYSNLIKDKELIPVSIKSGVLILPISGYSDGFVYLAAIIDIYSRKIVGYAIGRTLSSEWAITALNMAIATRDTDNLIHHYRPGD